MVEMLLETPLDDGIRAKGPLKASCAWGDVESPVAETRTVEAAEREPPKEGSVQAQQDVDYIDALICDYFKVHGMIKALEVFQEEKKSAPVLSTRKLVQKLHLTRHYKKQKTLSALDLLVEVRTEMRQPQQQQPKVKTRRVKPKLKVNIDVEGEAGDLEYNKVGKPGSTPKTITLGQPGLTPKHPSKYPQVEIQDESKTYVDRSTPGVRSILRKADYQAKTNRIRFNETHPEVFFCRMSPSHLMSPNPSQAVEAFQEFVQDTPGYHERFVELQSSDVGKYTIGQSVSGLGMDGTISGQVYKKQGTKQCGTGGPGTITIDTKPAEAEAEEEDLIGDLLAQTSCVTASPTSLSNEIDELVDQLTITDE